MSARYSRQMQARLSAPAELARQKRREIAS
jgi:hypothetical protein